MDQDRIADDSQKRPELNNIAIVLVEPLFPGNIGSVARAMKNFSLSDLRLVHPPQDRGRDAYNMAHGARELLENARRTFTLEEAIDDTRYLVATTARLGGWRRKTLSPRDAAPKILEIAATNKVGILFGTEDRGLTNEQLSAAQMLVTIPTGEMASLNLAQAVLLMGYELFVEPFDSGENAGRELAKVQRFNKLIEHLRDSFTLIDFMRSYNTDYWMQAIRRIFGRARLDEHEIDMLFGLARQIRWAARHLPDAEERFGRIGQPPSETE